MAKPKASTSTSVAKYGGFDLEEAEAAAKELKEGGGGGQAFLKLDVGKTRIRWIPPLPGKKWRRVVNVHYVDIPGAGRASFNCPRLEAKRACRLCSQAQKLMATGNEAHEKKGKKLLPQRRCYAAVINRSAPEQGPIIFAFGRMVEQQLIELRQDNDEGGDFVDPIEGFDISITRTGTGQFDTRYVVRAGKRVPLTEDTEQMHEWIEGQPNLEKWCKVLSDEEIDAILRGEDPRDAKRRRDDDDEDEPRRLPASSQRRGRVEDDMDEVDDD